MSSSLPSMLRLGSGIGVALLGSAWLACGPIRAQVVPTAGMVPTVGPNSLGTGVLMNGQAAPGCSSGLCQVLGGTSRGTNLFHRFDRFDTRYGITRVDFLNGLQRAVIVGVTNRSGSFITVPVTGQNGASLFFLSPGGISISGGGGFTGWGDLLLTSKANLAFGANRFNAFHTLPDNSPDWSSDPVLAHASLSTDLQSLTDNGLTGDGPISVAGSMISVNRNLLIDSGANTLTLANHARLEAGTSGTIFGETSKGGLSLKGKTISSSDATITALKSQLLGDDIRLTRTAILSPRGQIRIAASDRITLVNSKLDISPQKIEDLYSDGLGFRSGPINSTVPGVINLATTNPSGAGIVLKHSSLDASIDLNARDGQGNLRFKDLQGNPLFEETLLHPALVAGNMLITSAGQLDIDQSAIKADASRSFAGHIVLASQQASGGVNIRNNSLITANSPQGSGDLDVFAKGGVTIANSRLEANSTGYPSDFLINLALPPAGNIFITSDGGSAGISLTDSIVRSRYELTDQALATAYADVLDPADNQQTLTPGSLIQLRSAGGIHLQRSHLDVSSSSGFAGTIELLARGGNGISIGGSTLAAAVEAPNGQAPAALAADLLNGFGCTDCFLSVPGTISLYSQAGISVGKDQTGSTDSLLDLSSSYPFNDANLLKGTFLSPGQEVAHLNLINSSTTRPLALGSGTQIQAPSAPGGLAGSQVFIGSQAGVSLVGTTINATGGPGGEITITNRGSAPMAISGSRISNIGDDEDRVPALRLIGREGSPIQLGAGNQFDTDPAQIVSARTAEELLNSPNPDDYTAYLAASDVFAARADALNSVAQNGPQISTANGSVPRQQFLSQSPLLDLSNPAEEVDTFIDNRDPNRVIITNFSRSNQVFQPAVRQTSDIFDLGNADEVARLRALLGATFFNSVVDTTNQNLSRFPIGATQKLAGTAASPEIARSGVGEAAPNPTDTSFAITPLAVKSAENLDPKKALESLGEGEITSLQAVSQAMGLGSNLASPPSLSQLQGYMRAAIEAIRQRQKSLAWNQDGRQAPALASVDTGHLLLAKASFDPAGYKPAILRYSFTAKPAAGTGTAAAAETPATGLIDIVLVLPDGAPQGWRVEVPIARFREALSRHYTSMASMGPLPEANPAATSAASQLAQLLLEPVLPTLKANGITSLIISSDLSLIDVPYASLPLGNGYLAQTYAVTITPSLALTSLTSNEKPPVYGKDALIRAGATEFANGLAPLPMVEQELTTIAREDGGTVLLNQAFNSSSLLKALADPAVKRIHIASHAELKPGREGDARIYTSSSSVGLKELGQLRQRNAGQSLDLVSLSACRSAVSGSELELGFAGMAIQLGAKSAIGTKWYVDDLATSSFFVQFYRYLDQGIPKAEAIQLTQKAFLNGEVRLQGDKVVGSGGNTLIAGLTPAQQRRYAGGFSHPYFWAAMQLVGSPW